MNLKKISRIISAAVFLSIFLMGMSFFIFTIVPQKSVPEPLSASTISSSDSIGDEWTMDGYGFNRTGATNTIPVSGTGYNWSIDLGTYLGTPIVGDNIIYVGGGNGYEYFTRTDLGVNYCSPVLLSSNDQYQHTSKAGSTIYSTGELNYMAWVNAYTGAANNSKTFLSNEYTMSSPLIYWPYMYVAAGTSSYGWYMYNLNCTDGISEWAYPSSNSMSSAALNPTTDRLFFGENTNITCLYRVTGSLFWNYTTNAFTTTTPVLANNSVFAANTAGNVYSLTQSTGSLNWMHSLGGQISGLCYANGYLYVSNTNDNVTCLNANTGAIVWSINTGAQIQYACSYANSWLYVPSFSKIMCLNGLTGAMNWSYDAGTIINSAPAIAGGFVYITAYSKLIKLPMVMQVGIPSIKPISPNPTNISTIQVSWNVAVGASTYSLYRSTSQITTVSGLIPITSTTGLAYNDTLSASGTYYYAVVAVNSLGSSAVSNNTSVTYNVPSSGGSSPGFIHTPTFQHSFPITAGFNHHISFAAYNGLNVSVDFNSTSDVNLNISNWDTNPVSQSPGFGNDSNAIYLNFDVDNISAIVFPIILYLPLFTGLQGLNVSALKFMTFNTTTNSWQDTAFTISVNGTSMIATITIQHFSLFGLGVNAGSTTTGSNTNSNGSTNSPPFSVPGYPLWSIAVVTTFAIVVSIRKRKIISAPN